MEVSSTAEPQPQAQVEELPAVSRPVNGKRATPSPFKRDESTKLMVPSWCVGVEADLYEPVSDFGLGLVDIEVYERMCGSVRTQVQRIWSPRDTGHSLLAAMVRALEFNVDSHIEPPSRNRVNELRDSMLKTAAAWSEEELSACVPEYDAKAMSKEQFVQSADRQGDSTLLHLYQALHPTAPRAYIIVGNPSAHPQCSLVIEGGKSSPTPDTRCVVLFRNMSTEPLPHVEVVGWKRGSRGPSPLRTVMEFSDGIIQSLEAWSQQHQASLSTKTRKRARKETSSIDLSSADN